MEILRKLFVEWELKTWAEVLEIFGALFAIGGFFIGLFLKSQVQKLKNSFIFDKRVNDHLKRIQEFSSGLSNLLNNYDENRENIRSQFGICQAELENLIPKLNYGQRKKSLKLLKLVKTKKNKPLSLKRQSESRNEKLYNKLIGKYYQTSYDDVWNIYNYCLEIIRQIENIKKDKDKSLKT